MGMMDGRRALIMGVANDHSIAWGIAQALAAEGCDLAFTYQGEAFGKRVRPLAAKLGSERLLDVNVTDDASLDAAFASLQDWGPLDVVVHAIAFSDKSELTGRFVDTSRANFKHSLDISCYSLIEVARRAAPLMTEGGSILTLTFDGSRRVMPFYNVMGVAKAALEASVRYLAADLGPEGIRVNAISPGPMKTLAGAAIGGAGAPSSMPSRIPRCGPTRPWRRWAARPSGSPPRPAPAPPARSSTSTAVSTPWACPCRRTSDAAGGADLGTPPIAAFPRSGLP